MPLLRIAKSWQMPENEVTAENAYFNRRRFLQGLIGVGIAGSSLGLTACGKSSSQSELEESLKMPKIEGIKRNSLFAGVDRPIADEDVAGRYNNFYEFGGGKNIWLKAQKLPIRPWQVAVSGLVKNPRTYDIDDLKKTFPLEERIYRFRCVEAWSMVLPWIGFPMRTLIEAVEPTAEAKFVRFTSFYDPDITPGPGFHFGALPWPYTEGLSIAEMANELAFFAVGLYGHDLPRQHGAPIRMVIPWKYGFKGAKSIVKIEFVNSQPATYWNTIDGHEYDFEANVNPGKPHPRWSQATEKFIGKGPGLSWEIKETLPYNGYGQYVANLYP
jgi:sulfoxide reductase catalytic subunit YedY